MDAGKTTLSEAMLYLAGEIKQQGRVDHGNAFLDDDPIERERGITIFSRQAHFDIPMSEKEVSSNTSVTLIDTPGHVDFTAETERSLWVLDYALLVISGSEGVQAHTKTLARMLKERDIPVFIFVNKMDIAIKKKEEIVAGLVSELDVPAVDFSDAGKEAADKGMEKFIDDVTLASPRLAEAVLESMQTEPRTEPQMGTQIKPDMVPQMKPDSGSEEDQILSSEQIADAVAAGEVVPVMFGSALKNEGVKQLLEIIGKYTKQPERKDESDANGSATNESGANGFGAKVYKTMMTKEGERLSFLKITSGTLKVRDSVEIKSANNRADTPSSKKVNQIRLYQGGKYQTVDEAGAGTVCAVTGLGNIVPGTALGNEEPVSEYSSEPFMAYSIIIPDGKDPHAVMDDMQTLTAEDPALAAGWSDDGSEIMIRIMGEVQLEVLQRIIKERFGYEVGFGKGQVLYLETITDIYEGVGHFEPLRHYAEVHLVVSPGERGSGITITSDVSDDELALNWQRLIWTHLEEKAHTGVLTGSPLTDLKISIAAGAAHLKHTMGGDFREATYRALRNAMMQAKGDGNVLLLEPWCEYEMELPSENMGRAVTDIKQMGATQDSLEQRETTAVIKGKAPSAKMEPYRQILTGYTSGEGKLQIVQWGYDAAIDAEGIIEEIGYDAERDTANPADSVFVNHSGSDIVRWDEVFEYMHLPSVLQTRERLSRDHALEGMSNAGNGGVRSGWSVDPNIDPKEAARRRAAAERDLQKIFEMTYGPVKQKVYKESTVVSSKDDLSEENAARNEEIKAKHEAKRESKEGRKNGNNNSSRDSGKDRSIDSGKEKGPLLLIDGYNLIFADEELKELSARDVGSARDSLIERLVNYAGYTGFEVKVVFDAYKVVPGDGSAEKDTNVEVIYTAANELADVRIGRMAKEAGSRQVYVVSSDRLVQQDVWTKGAMRISSREFLALLNTTEEEIRSRL